MPDESVVGVERELWSRVVGALGTRDVAEATRCLVDGGVVDGVAVYGPAEEREGAHLCLATYGSAVAAASLWPGRDEAGRALLGAGVQLLSNGSALVPLRHDGALVGAVKVWGWRVDLEVLVRCLSSLGPALARAVVADRASRDAAALHALLPLLGEGVLGVTTDGQVRLYSPPLQDLVGWTEEDVRRQGWTYLVYDAAEREAATRAIAALVLGRPSRGVVRRLKHKSGAPLDVAISSAMVPDPAGGAPTLIGVMRDHTSAREARRRAERDESLARLGRLAGSVAHDFNNLLCAVMGHAELVEMFSGEPERVRSHAATIADAAERGARLARELLAFSGAGNSVAEAVDLAQTARSVVDLLRPQLGEGVAVRLFDRGAARVEADPGQVHQALMNLLRNAVDAVEGRGHIEVEVSDADIPAAATWRGPTSPAPGVRAVRVTVRDDGPGFPRRSWRARSSRSSPPKLAATASGWPRRGASPRRTRACSCWATTAARW